MLCAPLTHQIFHKRAVLTGWGHGVAGTTRRRGVDTAVCVSFGVLCSKYSCGSIVRPLCYSQHRKSQCTRLVPAVFLDVRRLATTIHRDLFNWCFRTQVHTNAFSAFICNPAGFDPGHYDPMGRTDWPDRVYPLHLCVFGTVRIPADTHGKRPRRINTAVVHTAFGLRLTLITSSSMHTHAQRHGGGHGAFNHHCRGCRWRSDFAFSTTATQRSGEGK